MRLTPGELRVMRLLWEHGEMKPPEMLERHDPPIKDPALRSYLSILLDKGHVTRRREGRAYFYSAKTAQRSAFREMLGELMENFCDGSARQLMLNLTEHELLSEDDLKEIAAAAEEAPATQRKSKQAKKNKKTKKRK